MLVHLALWLLKGYSTEHHGHQQISPCSRDPTVSPQIVKTLTATVDPREHRWASCLKPDQLLATCADLRGGWGRTGQETLPWINCSLGALKRLGLLKLGGYPGGWPSKVQSQGQSYLQGWEKQPSELLQDNRYLPKSGKEFLKKEGKRCR